MIEADQFLVKQWADGCVVFDRLRGDTHAFSAEAVSRCFDQDQVHLAPSRIQALIDGLGVSSVSSDGSTECSEVLPHEASQATVNSN
ncbi:hypothetical protein [Hydrogenophaga sp.]|jgi:hypothetical protein|uniref:hypothetical protein n=1 Tax=Hydrogenophaga sp. TaxID=1904254 RepID=UPI0026388E3C|nr:hypothetical protein [Hydrogenophaga sp.]